MLIRPVYTAFFVKNGMIGTWDPVYFTMDWAPFSYRTKNLFLVLWDITPW